MGVYLYCIAPAGHAPTDGLAGLGGADVVARRAGPLAVWASELERAPRPSVDAIRRHNRVIEQAANGPVTPLPLRFGQWFDTGEEADAELERQCEHHQDALRRVAGALEFGVRVLDPAREGSPGVEKTSGATSGARSGREHMRALMREQRGERALAVRRDELASELREAVGSTIRRGRVDALETPRGLASIAHLVERGEFDEYRRRLDAFRARWPELRFLVSGPWPPYSFVE